MVEFIFGVVKMFWNYSDDIDLFTFIFTEHLMEIK